jgi:hypothetical protein
MMDSSQNNFLSKKKFTKMIETTVKTKGLTYMDAVVYLCNDNNIELEDVKKFISLNIKERIEAEAMNLNFLPKGNTLPLD